MKPPFDNPTNPHRQQGFTLVELMVVLTISMILLGGVLKVFANSKQTYRIQEALSRLQENGRYATEFLSQNIRMADFWGCVNAADSVVNGLNPAGAGFVEFVSDDVIPGPGGGIGGIDGANGAADTLTLRGAVGAGLTVQPPFAPQPAARIFVPANNILQTGDIVLVSDCISGDIFQITNYNNNNGTVVHNTGNGNPPPGNLNGGLARVYGGDAKVYVIRQTVYTIANGASGQPTLFRNVNQAGAVEIVEGVEDMQILYGEDTNGDGAPNAYVTATTVVDMANVISVRVTLTLRTLDDNVALQAGDMDNRLRRTFTTTVAIRNRLS